MTITELYQEALAMALQLPPRERLHLIEQVVSSVERDLQPTPVPQPPTEGHWGKMLNQLMDELNPIETKYPEIEDPVEWVKHHRAEQRRQRLGDWGEDE